jgi:hypothetical protein
MAAPPAVLVRAQQPKSFRAIENVSKFLVDFNAQQVYNFIGI